MSENKKKQLNHRTILFTCALDKKRFAIENNPFIDVSLLDVEDSVPQEKKILARSNVIEYFSRKHDFYTALRINPIGSHLGLMDIMMLCDLSICPDIILLSKVTNAEEIKIIRKILADKHTKDMPYIYSTIEYPLNSQDIYKIANNSDGLVFGSADYAAEVGCISTPICFLYVKSIMLAAAGFHKIACIESPNFDIYNQQKTKNDCKRAIQQGFSGMVALTPKQAEIIKQEFIPKKSAVEEAKFIIDNYNKNPKFSMVGGKVIGPPFVKMCKTILEKSESKVEEAEGRYIRMEQNNNLKKMIELSDNTWKKVVKSGLCNIRVKYTDTNKVKTNEGHHFLNMCSCSYLGLDRNKNIINGAIKAITNEKTILLPTSRGRTGLQLIDEAENSLEQIFKCKARITISCSAASSGMLPLLASGFLTEGETPIMVFDKHAHFSMAHMKPSCANETKVLTCNHNDMDFMEQTCKENKKNKIVYVADGAYSMGGVAPIRELKELQDKYGLYLYFDDSHSISAFGERGRGYVLEKMKGINSRTIIVSSLGKGFGVSGGLILTAPEATYERYINYYAGPQIWSQTLSVPSLGGIIESAKIHLNGELPKLQEKLNNNIKFFDSMFSSKDAGRQLPIRILECKNADEAIEFSQKLFKQGYYSSAVFFPIVAKGRGGIRVMIRADMCKADLLGFYESYNGLLA